MPKEALSHELQDFDRVLFNIIRFQRNEGFANPVSTLLWIELDSFFWEVLYSVLDEKLTSTNMIIPKMERHFLCRLENQRITQQLLEWMPRNCIEILARFLPHIGQKSAQIGTLPNWQCQIQNHIDWVLRLFSQPHWGKMGVVRIIVVPIQCKLKQIRNIMSLTKARFGYNERR